MTAAAGYTRLRRCGTEAINSVTSVYSCRTNDCICRLDRMPSMVTAIQTGASRSCYDNDVDATSAVAVYLSYCSTIGYTLHSFANVSIPLPEGEYNKSFNSSKSLISLLVAIKGTLL